MEVTDFQTEVIEASHQRPVLVDFWAPWCGPCRVLGPVLEKLAAEGDGAWNLAKVNTDVLTAEASRYRVSSIPAVKLFVDGEVVNEFVGALPEPRVRQWLSEALPGKHVGLLDEARAAFENGDEAKVEDLATMVLVEDPSNAEARVLLARTLLFRNPSRSEELAREAAATKTALFPQCQAIEALSRLIRAAADLDKLPEGPGRETYASALRALAAQELDSAAAGFVDTLRRDRRYNDDAARKAGIALFGVLGEKHPVTQKHRRAFEMAVF